MFFSLPEVVLPNVDANGLRCITTGVESNGRMNAGEATIYEIHHGPLNCYDDTPQYCFDRNNNLASFYLNFERYRIENIFNIFIADITSIIIHYGFACHL